MVERGPEKAGVGGSIPSLGISFEWFATFLLALPGQGFRFLHFSQLHCLGFIPPGLSETLPRHAPDRWLLQVSRDEGHTQLLRHDHDQRHWHTR